MQRFRITIVLLTLVVAGCSKSKNDAPAPEPKDTYVQNWIYQNMSDYYFWENLIPKNPDYTLEPSPFFYSLINKKDDPYSWIVTDYRDLLSSLGGVQKEAGYEYELFLIGQGSQLAGIITYIKKGSPAENSGLKRGDIFTAVNGSPAPYNAASSSASINSLLNSLKENHSLTVHDYYKTANNQDSLGLGRTISLNTVVFEENPIYLDTVYTVNNQKIGYLKFNFFAPDKGDESNVYNNQFKTIFQKFKSAGIQHLILDLRYNPGGSELTTVLLGSLIGKNVDGTKVFFKRAFNAAVTKALQEQEGQNFNLRFFSNEPANIGNQLDKLVVLTSSNTASAGELLINGLRPYMPIHIIGDTTSGKNLGSISLYEENDPKNKWGLQPIVSRVENSLGQSDYGVVGFAPNTRYVEGFLLGQLGDVNEPMLSRALAYITGDGRMRSFEEPGIPKVGSSRQDKAYSEKLLMQDKLK